VDTNCALNPARRLAYAFIGLLAGDTALLLFLLKNAFRADLLASHMGVPAHQLPLALEMFTVYGFFSFVGWLLVGLPIAIFFPARWIARLPWFLGLLVGAALGPLALLLIFLLLGHGHLEFPGTFKGTDWLWVYSILVSTFSFVLYVALVKRKSR
jgi:hypothetical protein